MTGGPTVVGVVGDAVADLVAAVEAAGGEPRTGTAETVAEADPDVFVTQGEGATLAVTRKRPTAPIVPVDAGRGLRSVPAERVGEAMKAVVAEEWTTETHPLVAIEQDGDRVATALLDVTLVTAEAARISEFGVATPAVEIGQFRADGVVVATPAGTPGYARQVGTPIAAPATGVLTVAPIAPFATNPDHWIVPDDQVHLSVERDEADVTLFADDREVGPVPMDEPVTLSTGGSVRVAVLPQSRRRFPASGGDG